MSDADSLKNKIRHVYDLSSVEYVAKYSSELDFKPRDRELLTEFVAATKDKGTVLDLGCGPGHATDLLRQLGAAATGVDLSPGMIEAARLKFPKCQFVSADFCSLPFQDESTAGIVALYAIVNLTPEVVATAFAEMHRVLAPGGHLLISFHIGNEQLSVDNFLSTGESLQFQFFSPDDIVNQLSAAGFVAIDPLIRDAYPQEHPTKRCYIRARRAD